MQRPFVAITHPPAWQISMPEAIERDICRNGFVLLEPVDSLQMGEGMITEISQP
jgi:hypothetical protein